MSLLNAAFTTVAKKVNNSIYKHQMSKAKKYAYEQTGNKIKKAKKAGKYCNGAKIYQQQLTKRQQTLKEQKELRDHFIDNCK